MKENVFKLMLFAVFLLLLQRANAQTLTVGSENFDGTTSSFTSNGWSITTNYALSGTKSMHGNVPIWTNDSIVLTSPIYDFSNYAYVILRFSHICKVSVYDIARIEYRLDQMGTQGNWTPIPTSSYEGTGVFSNGQFNAASYSDWQVNDSMAIPTNSWWKEETFDLTNQVAYDKAQFRFVLKKTATTATQINYGWLIDDFKVMASTYEVKSPVVMFLSSFNDTLPYVGPYLIRAKAATRTAGNIQTPYLHYTATHPNLGTVVDSVLMTAYSGDSLWQAYIPQYPYGTSISYSLTARDAYGNDATANNATPFVSKRFSSISNADSIQVGTSLAGGTYYWPFTAGGNGLNYAQHLYKSDLIINDSMPKVITKIAFYASSISTILQKSSVDIYLSQTTQNTLSSYEDPMLNGHFLVYSGPIAIKQGWNEITFTVPFLLYPGQNLIYTTYDNSMNCGNSSVTWGYNHTGNINSTSYSATYYRSTGIACNNTGINQGPSSYLPTTRFYFDNKIGDSSSVSMVDIDLTDTIVCSPQKTTPVVAKFRNEGSKNLTSAVFGWALNGVLQNSNVSWRGNVYCDNSDTFQIGSFTPTLNGYDTITIWVNMPNGVIDTNYYDDTITKIVYGTADLEMEFTKKPYNIVYSTGPYDIEAKIHSRIGNLPTNVHLIYVVTTDNDTTIVKADTLGMKYIGDDKWLTTIPCISFESMVNYSITLTDTMGNICNIADSYNITKGTATYDKKWVYDTTLVAGLEMGNTDRNMFPYTIDGGYSWSRNLYLANELTAGTITNLAFKLEEWDDDGSGDSLTKQYCYMKVTNSTSLTTTSYVDPIADGATLVWSGTIPDLTGLYDYWVDIELQTPFTLAAGDNLIVYWIDSCNRYDNHGYSYWWYVSEANNDNYPYTTHVRQSAGNANLTMPSTGSGSTARPIARFQFGHQEIVGGSTIGGYVYVDTNNCKNNRPSDEHVIVDDAKSMWSRIIYPASKLQAGTISKIGFYLSEVDDGGGRYAPVAKPNVFIYMRATTDTAITSSTYVQPFTDGATLVWNGTVPAFDVNWKDYWYDFDLQRPFTINSGENLLVYIVDSSCIGSGDCFYMWYMNNSGIGDSRVASWSGRCDYANANGYQETSPVARFYYNGTIGGSSNSGDYVYTDTSDLLTRGDDEAVIVLDALSGWQKYLYASSELNGGGTMSKIGFYLKECDGRNGTGITKNNIKIYMQAVTDTTFTNGNFVHPLAEGATLVWQGSVPDLSPYSGTYYDFELDIPFTINAGENLKVSIIDSSCTAAGDDYYLWYSSYTNNDTRLSGMFYSRCDFQNATGRPDDLRPVARFYFAGDNTGFSVKDAVALENIIAPREAVPVGNHPISVVIRNKGTNTLDSCTISYSINGGSPIVYTYRGSLEENFVDTVTIGTYNGVVGNFDSLIVYVSYPNGVIDTLTLFDDTLVVAVVPCGGNLSGTYIIGSSANAHFANFEQFKQTVKYCGMGGTIKLTFENGTYGNLDLSSFTSIKTATDTLIITSQSGNAADVVFSSNANTINIGDNKNIYLQDITINNTGYMACVYLQAADNIEIANCALNASFSSFSNSGGIVFNSNGSYNLGNVRILNNTIIGGHSGIYIQFMDISQNNNWANVTIVGNTIKDFYYNGIYGQYGIFDRIVDNKIICGITWNRIVRGILLNQSKIDTIARNTITLEGVQAYGYGMYLSQVANRNGGNYFVVNNEIFNKSSNNYWFQGIYLESSANIYHNTVYDVATSGTQYCLQWNTFYASSIKNNIFYNATSNAPVYLNSDPPTGNLDYNNYFNPANYAIFRNNTPFSLTSWQSNSSQDAHSICIMPNFKDTSINLDIINYKDMMANNVGINEDKVGNNRLKKTSMGAYTAYIATLVSNLSSVQFVEPIDISAGDGTCAPDYTPVKIIISNTGTDSVDFTLNPMKLSLRVSGAISLSIDTTINTGVLDMFEQDTFEIISNLNVSTAGTYYLTAFLTCAVDTFYADDTISKTYAVRLALPMDENFAGGMPSTLSVFGNNTNDGWKVVNGNVNNVVSQYGNAMLVFDGTRGMASKIYTGQMTFVNVNKPTLEFWYYHDTSATSSQMDYTSVAYTLDGGSNFKSLLNLYKNNGIDHGWKQYTLPLDSAIGNNCVRIVFYSMRLSTSEYDGNQYIDRMRIYTKQDIAVSEILLDNMTTCHLYSDVNIVLENKTNQTIDFSEYPTSIQVNIVDTATRQATIPLNNGILMPLQKDTFTIANAMNFINGNYTIFAQIVPSIDDFPNNDTLSTSFVINPELTVVAQQITNSSNCIDINSQVNQNISISNSGNMDMEDLILKLEVSNSSGSIVETLYDTISGVFSVGTQITYVFKKKYVVPQIEEYALALSNGMCDIISNVPYSEDDEW